MHKPKQDGIGDDKLKEHPLSLFRYSSGTQLWFEFVKLYPALPYALVYVFINVVDEVELLTDVLDALSEL